MKKSEEFYKLLANIRKFSFKSVWLRNFFLIIVLEMLFVSFMALFYMYRVDKSATDEITEMNRIELQRSAETLDTLIGQMSDFGYYLSLENDMKRLFMELGVGEESSLYKSISGRIKSFRQTLGYVSDVRIYMEEAQLLVSENSVKELEAASDLGWLAYYEELEGENYILRSRCKDESYPFLLTMMLPVKNVRGMIGAVVIDIDLNKLNAAIGRSQYDLQQIYMLDDEGRLLYSSVTNAVKYPELIPEDLAELDETSDGKLLSGNLGERIILTMTDSEDNDIRYVMYSSMEAYDEQMSGRHAQILSLCLFAVLVGAAMSFFMATKTYQPIQEILDEVERGKELQKEHVPVYKEERSGGEEARDDFIEGEEARNEVHYITKLIRNTTRKNERMSVELSEWMERLGRAQLLALQSQINPHFFYNTLDAISWLAIERLGKENDVSEAMNCLANLLRLSLDRSSYFVTLKDELEHAELYMYLMNIRYSGKIKVEWDVPEQLLEEKVIRLCLQPILENAVRHGLKKKRYIGTIRVSGMLVQDMMVLKVEDDGVGMSVAECRRKNAELNTDYQTETDHVGIANVNQRIKIVFGEDYGVVLSPGEHGGVEVMLCFPHGQS